MLKEGLPGCSPTPWSCRSPTPWSCRSRPALRDHVCQLSICSVLTFPPPVLPWGLFPSAHPDFHLLSPCSPQFVCFCPEAVSPSLVSRVPHVGSPTPRQHLP